MKEPWNRKEDEERNKAWNHMHLQTGAPDINLLSEEKHFYCLKIYPLPFSQNVPGKGILSLGYFAWIKSFGKQQHCPTEKEFKLPTAI